MRAVIIFLLIIAATDSPVALSQTKSASKKSKASASPTNLAKKSAEAELAQAIDLLHEAVLAMRYHMGATAELEAVDIRQSGSSSRSSGVEKGNVFASRDLSVGWIVSDKDLSLVMKNGSDDMMRMHWDQCVFVDPSETSHRLIHSGVRLIDRQAPQPATSVAPNTTLNESIYPADHFKFESSWDRVALFEPSDISREISVILAIEVRGTVRNYTFRFRIRASNPAELHSKEQSAIMEKVPLGSSLEEVVATLGRQPDERNEQKTSSGTFVHIEYRQEHLGFELLDGKLENVLTLDGPK